MTPLWLSTLWLLLVVVTLLGVALGRLPWVAMNRATICLVGATLLVASGALPLAAAYQAIDMDTIVLLLAMMILNVNLRLAGFFRWVARWAVARRGHPTLLLGLLMGVSGLLSALFLNDTIVLTFTPLVVEVVTAAALPPVPFLVGLAVSANIGSVATMVGNPQNMLIGMASGISFRAFSEVLAPLGIGGVLLAWGVVALLHRRELRAAPDALSTPALDAPLHRPLLRKSLLAAGVMLAALLAGVAVPLAALGAASLLLISRRLHPDRVFQEIDWGLLVFFAALFVVTRAVERVGFSAALVAWFTPTGGLDIPSLTVVGALLSNLISNVPAVLLLRPLVAGLPDSGAAWLTLAMATTFAGNLTLLGSVANLIVAESAHRQGVLLSFRAYLRVGLPITLLTLAGGCLYLQWWFSLVAP